jgi:hypothetical protein
MSRDSKNTIPWVVAAIAAALTTRCSWLNDMEFKSDEMETVREIARSTLDQWTPVAPVSNHSGIAHSTGFFYFLHYLAFDYQPLGIVAWIAALNAIAIVVPLWWFRRSAKYACTFALCATSLTLVVGSRKIWTPDLQAAWACIGVGLLGLSLQRSRFWAFVPAALAAFFLIMAGHMYLPGAYVAAVAGLGVLIACAISRRWAQCWGWLIGAMAGWATFIPWAITVLSAAPSTHRAPRLVHTHEIANWISAVRTGITICTPYEVYDRYINPDERWLLIHHPGFWLSSTWFWTAISSAIGVTVFGAAIWLAVKRWRVAIRDPLLLTAAVLLLTMPTLLYAARLGSYIHYWFAAIPFFFYWIAWGATRGARIWKWLTVALCVTSLLAAASFINLVHENHGLPGEYGESYSSQG